ncbi:MAG: YjbQ family protein [Candidatus Tectomicrobia bacterium]|uniref:YjbQ family protein n=1 Tax=Tectimicrobiota bacterium TaxID=2528274 RepID=A0A932I1P7_UNCTE|nr:YjbQ family protein [Candidatus Tectomicrobia bacterium]
MKAHTGYLAFETKRRIEFINITREVEAVVRESGVREGLVLVNPMHITASVYVNDAEPGLIEDYQEWLKTLVDTAKDYRHNRTGEDNAYAHLMRTVMGREAVVAITGGKLDFGPWEQIYYAEFDGRRKKRVLVKVLGE